MAWGASESNWECACGAHITWPDKEREARFKLNQLRNAAQRTPTLNSGSEHILTPSNKLNEESATECEALTIIDMSNRANRERISDHSKHT